MVLPLDKIKDDCIFVLDTNTLLVPYSTGSDSLVAIEKVYQKVKKQDRLKIPGQVVREFANNRPEKLKEIFQKLTRKITSIQNQSIGNYPLLEGIKSLAAEVRSWTWDDPVSKYKMPPGFKDGNKADDGIGDLLIWYTILEIAQSKKHVVFVSGDEKADWFHRSESQALYPRFELIAEFKERSDDKTFQIIKLSEFLQLFGADENAVKEVEQKESMADIRSCSYEFRLEVARLWEV